MSKGRRNSNAALLQEGTFGGHFLLRFLHTAAYALEVCKDVRAMAESCSHLGRPGVYLGKVGSSKSLAFPILSA